MTACLDAEACARELCAGMDASTGAAYPNPQQLARLVLVTCERLVCMMVEKVTTMAHLGSLSLPEIHNLAWPEDLHDPSSHGRGIVSDCNEA